VLAPKVPRFERMADRGLAKIRATYTQRGMEYGDTVEENQWLVLKAIMVKLGFPRPTDQDCRLIFDSAMVDVKYWRNLGGFKEDNFIDGGAYNCQMLGELDQLTTKPA